MTEHSSNPLNLPATRRSVVLGAAAVAGAAGMSGLLPTQLGAAAAAEPEEFDLSKIKHVVYVMQENRSFDHYFGTFPGVRGFDDPDAMTLPNGNSVFMQPDAANPDGYLLPFHMDTQDTGAAAVPSLSHDWRDQHASWNKGAMDGWMSTHLASDGAAKGSFTMGYMTQEDIPFHWALAENFTLLDNYHCSVMGPTYPNRAVWMSGTNDPQGEQGGPILETVAPNMLTWKCAAEVLYDAGYSVKTYSSSGSFNYFKWWQSFKTKGVVDDALYNWINNSATLFGNGTPGGVGNPLSPTAAAVSYYGFEEDCANGTLADVTWLFPDGPYASSEHPPNTPAAGAYFLASKLEALAKNADLWNSTVFIINYDENDGFFDHVPPPVPDPDLHPEEYVAMPSPRGTPGEGLPAGAGFRVPCLIISPWTVGGHVYSQVADHTSPLQLIEAITEAGGLSNQGPVTFDAITPWRRSTFDDLAGAFQAVPQAAPDNEEFEPAARQANYTAQLTASSLPMPARPGAAQTVPHQLPTDRQTPAASVSTPAPSVSTPAAAVGVAAGTQAAAGLTPVKSSVTVVTKEVRSGRRAALEITGAKPSSRVVVRHAHGAVVERAAVDDDGTVALRIGTKHLKAGHKHRYTVMYVDAAGHHHTRNVAFKVTH